MISRHIGCLVRVPRDALARGLIRLGVRPNYITVLGMALTVGAGVAIAAGRPYWRSWAVALMVASGACDLLDGTMAKIGNLHSRFGAFLDSVCDRVGDAALFFGSAAYFLLVWPAEAGGTGRPNLTLGLLAAAALLWAYLTSYIRARAENLGAGGNGGFWQRPERLVAVLLGLLFHHLTTAVWILGLLPATTVAHRLWRVRRACAADGPADPADLQPTGPWGLVLWRWPRGGLPFDLYAGTIIALLAFWDVPAADPLRDLWARWMGT